MSDTTISSSATVVATVDQVSRDIGDEAVILGFGEGMYYGLNPVGARVWSLIQEPRVVADVCSAISAEYDVDRDECERDVLELLRELAEENLIEVHT
jgi:Coenzyme PQQ synthesis protein D (PqqD)